MDLIREKLRSRGYHRLPMGGESSSSADQVTNQADKRVSGRDGANVSGDNNTVLVQATDHDAVMQGAEATRNAIALADSSTRTNAALTLGLFGAAADIQARAFDSMDSMFSKSVSSTQSTFGTAVDAVGSAYETAKAGDQRIVSMVGLAVVGLAGLALLSGKAR